VIFLGSVLLLLFALAGRLGRKKVLWSLAVPLFVALQIVLAWVGESHAAAGVLHPINAFVIVGLVGSLAGREWMGARAGAPQTRDPAT